MFSFVLSNKFLSNNFDKDLLSSEALGQHAHSVMLSLIGCSYNNICCKDPLHIFICSSCMFCTTWKLNFSLDCLPQTVLSIRLWEYIKLLKAWNHFKTLNYVYLESITGSAYLLLDSYSVIVGNRSFQPVQKTVEFKQANFSFKVQSSINSINWGLHFRCQSTYYSLKSVYHLKNQSFVVVACLPLSKTAMAIHD